MSGAVGLVGAQAPRTKPAGARVKVLKDSHHMLARLIALGNTQGEAAKIMGYSIHRVSVLCGDQAFKELIANYRGMVDEAMMAEVDEYFELANMARVKSARMINDRLDDPETDVSLRELVTIHADMADRTGYPKRSVALNVNVDFAARLDQAIKASNKAKVIEHQPAAPGSQADAVAGGDVSGEASPPVPLRANRR